MDGHNAYLHKVQHAWGEVIGRLLGHDWTIGVDGHRILATRSLGGAGRISLRLAEDFICDGHGRASDETCLQVREVRLILGEKVKATPAEVEGLITQVTREMHSRARVGKEAAEIHYDFLVCPANEPANGEGTQR